MSVMVCGGGGWWVQIFTLIHFNTPFRSCFIKIWFPKLPAPQTLIGGTPCLSASDWLILQSIKTWFAELPGWEKLIRQGRTVKISDWPLTPWSLTCDQHTHKHFISYDPSYIWWNKESKNSLFWLSKPS